MKISAEKLCGQSSVREYTKIKPEENDPTIVSSKVKVGQDNSNRSEEQIKAPYKLPCISIFFSSQDRQSDDLLLGGKRKRFQLTLSTSSQRKDLEENKFNNYTSQAKSVLLQSLAKL